MDRPHRGTGLPAALEALSALQREAVLHTGGPLIVLAGPGAGKTRVIVTRIARLIAPPEIGGAGAEAETVLALAFTNKSAHALRERLVGLVGPGRAARVRASTCNAFGRGVIRRFSDLLGLPAETTLMDSAERRRLLRDILIDHPAFRERAAEGIDAAVDRAWAFIDSCTTDGVTPADALAWCDGETADLSTPEAAGDPRQRAARGARLDELRPLADVYAVFDARRLAEGRLVFDDDINLPARLLREHGRVRAFLRDEIRHVVVDEFQDWSPAQIRLLALLAPPDTSPAPDLCVVGDDDQAIYAFRGADDRALARFAETWPAHREILLTDNYRSGVRVIETGNRIIAGAGSRLRPEKTITVAPQSDAEQPGSVEAVTVDSADELPRAVAALILRDRAATGRPWSDFAVLVRTNGRADQIALGLSVWDIPVRTPARADPADDAAVKDLLAWMRVLTDPRDTAHLQRLLMRPPVSIDTERAAALLGQARQCVRTGGHAVDALRDAAREDPALTDFLARLGALGGYAAEHSGAATVRRIIDDTRLLHVEALDPTARGERLRAILSALRFAQDKQPRLEQPGDLRALVRHYDALDPSEQTLRLQAHDPYDADPPDDAPDAVTVLTAHTAKGLEFDTVIVADVRKRTGFPSSERPADRAPLPQALTGRAPTDHVDEERRLFYVACTRAKRRLALAAKFVKRKPTPGDFFDEIARLDPEPWLERTDVAALYESVSMGAGGGLADDGAADAGAARRARIRRELDRARADALAALHRAERADLPADAIDAIADDLAVASKRIAALAHLRDAGALPDHLDEPFTGALAARLDARHTPFFAPLTAPIDLNFTMISDYQRCPRCFYVKNVIGLDEDKTPGLAVGDLAHRALEQFFTDLRDAESHGRPAPGVERVREIAARLLASPTRDERRTAELAPQVEALMLTAINALHDPASEILEIERRIEFPLALDSGEHLCVAKIDRIDRRADGSFRLVDYKTGKARKDLLEPVEKDLQFCLYVMALRRFFEIADDEPLEGVAEYWLLATGQRGVIALSDLDVAGALRAVNSVTDGMLEGRFDRGGKCKGLCAILPDDV